MTKNIGANYFEDAQAGAFDLICIAGFILFIPLAFPLWLIRQITKKIGI